MGLVVVEDEEGIEDDGGGDFGDFVAGAHFLVAGEEADAYCRVGDGVHDCEVHAELAGVDGLGDDVVGYEVGPGGAVESDFGRCFVAAGIFLHDNPGFEYAAVFIGIDGLPVEDIADVRAEGRVILGAEAGALDIGGDEHAGGALEIEIQIVVRDDEVSNAVGGLDAAAGGPADDVGDAELVKGGEHGDEVRAVGAAGLYI